MTYTKINGRLVLESDKDLLKEEGVEETPVESKYIKDNFIECFEVLFNDYGGGFVTRDQKFVDMIAKPFLDNQGIKTRTYREMAEEMSKDRNFLYWIISNHENPSAGEIDTDSIFVSDADAKFGYENGMWFWNLIDAFDELMSRSYIEWKDFGPFIVKNKLVDVAMKYIDFSELTHEAIEEYKNANGGLLSVRVNDEN